MEFKRRKVWDFTSAKELFLSARDATKEAKAIEQTLEKARTREQVHAQKYTPRTTCGTHDVMLATDIRMELEKKKGAILQQDKDLIAYAYSVLYGKGSSHGLSELIDIYACQAVEYKYLHDLKWQAISVLFDVPVITARRMCDYAFDVVDSLGFEKAIAGIGQATLDDFM